MFLSAYASAFTSYDGNYSVNLPTIPFHDRIDSVVLAEEVNGSGTYAPINTWNGIPPSNYVFNDKPNGVYRYRITKADFSIEDNRAYITTTYTDVVVARTPSVVVNISLSISTPQCSGTISGSWSSASGASHYNVQQRSRGTNGAWSNWDDIFVGVANTAFQHTSATSGRDYQYRVASLYVIGGTSGQLSAWRESSIIRKPFCAPLQASAPAANNINADNKSFNVTWVKPTGSVASYKLSERELGTSSWAVIYDGPNISFALSNKTNGASYEYRVEACNVDVCSSTSAITTVRLPYIAPSAPVSPSFSDINPDTSSFTINWIAPSGIVQSYRLTESPTGDAPWTQIYSGSGTSFTATNRINGANYFYQLEACNVDVCSLKSAVASVNLPYSGPTIPELDESRYEIHYGDVNNDGIDDIYLVTKPKFVPIHGDILIPLFIKDGDNYLYLSNSSGYDSPVINNDLNLNTLTQATPAAVQFYDYNSDQVIDVVLAQVGNTHNNVAILGGQEGPLLENVTISASAWSEVGGDIPDVALLNEPLPNSDDNVGALSGNGGVSGGSANYQIPIAVVPGRRGMQPQVSLNYSSQGGNSLAGMGWSLSAGSAISRCAATLAQDGFSAAPQYDAQRDRLCLDGQRLVLVSGFYGNNGAVYRTEIDSFVRVTEHEGINSSTSNFTVETKDGRVNTYGASSQSRHSAHALDEIFTWAIDTSTDRSGNTMHYLYNNHSGGEYTLDEIRYTGDIISQGDRSVKFEYELRIDATGNTDYSSSYIAGGETRQTQRLKKIRTQYQTTTVREYTVDYGAMSSSSGRSLLRSVEECAYKNGTSYCLPKTTFDWQEAAPRYVLEPIEFNNNGVITTADNSNQATAIAPRGDHDGDGTKDWPGIDSDYDGVVDVPGYHVNAEGEQIGTHSESLGYCFSPYNAPGLICMEGDFNQDGRTDSFSKSGGWGTDGSFKIKYAGDNTWTQTDITIDHYVEEPLSIADFNGDGWPDVVFREVEPGSPGATHAKLWLFLNTKNPAAPFSNANKVELLSYSPLPVGSVTYSRSAQIIGDMDGNGTPDILVSSNPAGRQDLSKPRYIIFTEITNNGGVSLREQDFTGYLDVHNTQVGEANFFHDVNADGLPDWLAINTQQNLSVKLNRGGTFENTWRDLGVQIPMRQVGYFLAPQEPEISYLPILSKTMTMDYNSDGRQELMFADTVEATSCSPIANWHLDANNNLVYGETTLCNESLWGLIQAQNDAEPMTAVPGEIYDTSARRYRAIYFKQNSDGSITAEVEQTGIVAAVTQRVVTDSTGDGLNDVVTTFECLRDNCTWNLPTHGHYRSDLEQNKPYVNRNLGAWTGEAKDASGNYNYAAIDVIKSTNNGVGIENHWTYKPLSSDDYNDKNPGNFEFYSPDHAYVHGGDISSTDSDYFHFGSSMMVVAEHKTTNPADGLNSRLFRYGGATYNNKGRGFMGFRSIVVEDLANGVKTRTDFHQMWPLVGNVERTCTWLSSENEATTNCNSAISDVSYTYDIKNTTTRSRWVGTKIQTKRTRDLTGRELLSTEIMDHTYDNYGNMVTENVENVDHALGGISFGSVTKSSESHYIIDESQWWLNKMDYQIANTNSVTGRTDIAIDVGTDPQKSTRANYEWDNTHRLPKKVTIVGGSVTETQYTSHGMPEQLAISASDVPTRRVLTDYTSDGYFIDSTTQMVGSTASNDDHVAEFVTDPLHGQIVQTQQHVLNNSSLTTTQELDAFGRVIEVNAPGQPTIYTQYRWCGIDCQSTKNNHGVNDITFTISTYQEGIPQQTVYVSPLGNSLLTQVTSFNGEPVYTQMAYDALGRKTFESVPYKSNNGSSIGTRYTQYDAHGRVLAKEVDQASGGVFTTSYVHNDFKTTITADTLTLSRTYNGREQLMQTVDADGNTTYYAYDGAGNPILLQDANGSRITSLYDNLGRKQWVDDPNMGVKSFTYNGLGEVLTETDANNDVLSYQYDNLGRVYARSANGVTESQWVFDTRGKGLLASESRDGHRKEFYFDQLFRPNRTEYVIDGQSYDMFTQYDANYGRVKGMVYLQGPTIAYEYNSRGYLKAQKNAKSGYVYQNITTQDAWGNITSSALGDGVLTENTSYYANTGQISDIRANNFIETLHHISYDQYDIFGNLKQKTTHYSGESTQENFSYDNLHRLTQSSRSGVANQVINYTYDAAGNLTSKTDYASLYTYTGAGNCNNKPNAVCQVTKVGGGTATFNYDNNGNLLSGDGKAVGYNVDNKPVSVSASGVVSQFSYGANRLRYKQIRTGLPGGTETTLYLDKAVEVIKQGSLTKTRYYLGDIVILEKQQNTDPAPNYQLSYLHKDRLGSVATITDHNGLVVERKGFDPFGKPRTGDWEDKFPAILGSTTTHRGFTGHEHLDNQQLIHMNGRIYDYNLGRFYSVDPYIQAPTNSQSLNPYSYIMNNPLAGVDPTGYTATCGQGHTCPNNSEKAISKEVKVTTSGSRITSTVTVTSNGNGSVTLSGGTAGARGTVKNALKSIASSIGSQGNRSNGAGAGSGASNDSSGESGETIGQQGGSVTSGDSSSARELTQSSQNFEDESGLEHVVVTHDRSKRNLGNDKRESAIDWFLSSSGGSAMSTMLGVEMEVINCVGPGICSWNWKSLPTNEIAHIRGSMAPVIWMGRASVIAGVAFEATELSEAITNRNDLGIIDSLADFSAMGASMVGPLGLTFSVSYGLTDSIFGPRLGRWLGRELYDANKSIKRTKPRPTSFLQRDR